MVVQEVLLSKQVARIVIQKFHQENQQAHAYSDQLDEQKLLKNNGKLFIASKRLDAIQQAENENYDIAILDDGLQDNSINCDISFVCFNNLNWIGNGLSIPC